MLIIESAYKIRTGEKGGKRFSVFLMNIEYIKSKEYYEKALSIKVEIGDRAGERTFFFFNLLVKIAKLKNVSRKRFRSEWKLLK